MVQASQITSATRARALQVHARTQWALRETQGEPILLGVTHLDVLLPSTKRIVRGLRKKGYNHLGLELPANHQAKQMEPEFFSPLAEFARAKGYSVTALDVPYDVDFYTKRAGALYALAALEMAGGDLQKALEIIGHEVDEHRKLLFAATGISSTRELGYVDPDVHGASIREFFNRLQAQKFLREEIPERLRTMAREMHAAVNAHMLRTIQDAKPDVVVIGLFHAEDIASSLQNYRFVRMPLFAIRLF